VFLAAGESKADALARAFGPDATPDPEVPSSMIPTVTAELTLLVDAPAAAGLDTGSGTSA
jgi:6-phosphogluconolactonase/glucosamine-6-phosphate isomerase/deaminase